LQALPRPFVFALRFVMMRAPERSGARRAVKGRYMGRGLDHIVHAVRDLDAAAETYRRLGFTVGARNRHPWGTHNHIVQTPGFFVELLTFAEPDKLGDDGFSRLFGAFNRDFLKRGEGLSLLVLESKDAAADQRAFRAAGVAASDVMRFEREGKRPDGSVVKVAFSLDFASDSHAPGIAFCTCQQHYPENFWNPAFQRHDNGTQAVRGVVMVADDPSAHSRFLSVYTDVAALHTRADEVSAVTPRGVLSVMAPARFAEMFGGPPPQPAGGARLAAIRFGVADVGRARSLLETNAVAHRSYHGSLVIDGGDALGATISLEPMAKSAG
jgi:hypothetical protein